MGDKVAATAMMDKMRAETTTNTGRTIGDYTISMADDFKYTDPVDGSVAQKQGIRFLMSDESRKLDSTVEAALKDLTKIALGLCDIKTFCGTETPTVITQMVLEMFFWQEFKH